MFAEFTLEINLNPKKIGKLWKRHHFKVDCFNGTVFEFTVENMGKNDFFVVENTTGRGNFVKIPPGKDLAAASEDVYDLVRHMVLVHGNEAATFTYKNKKSRAVGIIDLKERALEKKLAKKGVAELILDIYEIDRYEFSFVNQKDVLLIEYGPLSYHASSFHEGLLWIKDLLQDDFETKLKFL